MAKKNDTAINNVVKSSSNLTNGEHEVDIVYSGTKDKCLSWVKRNAKRLGLGNKVVGDFDIDDPDTWESYTCEGNEGEVVTTYRIRKSRVKR